MSGDASMSALKSHSTYFQNAFMIILGLALGVCVVSLIGVMMVLLVARFCGRRAQIDKKDPMGTNTIRIRRLHAILVAVFLFGVELSVAVVFGDLASFYLMEPAVALVLVVVCCIPLMLTITVCVSPFHWPLALLAITGSCCLCCESSTERASPPSSPSGGSDRGGSGEDVELKPLKAPEGDFYTLDESKQTHAHHYTFVELLCTFWKGTIAACIRAPIHFTAVAVSTTLGAAFVVLALYGMCYCSNPTEFTTWLSRKASNPSCQEDSFCHLYPMLGVDHSRMRIVGHVVVSGDAGPTTTTIRTCLMPLVPTANSRYEEGDACDPTDTLSSPVVGKIVYHAHITEDMRYLAHHLLTGLEPKRVYKAVVEMVLGDGSKIQKTIIFNTLPNRANDTTTPIHFISGGDYYSGPRGTAMVQNLLDRIPDLSFIYVGGDLSYSNNIRACYRRMDYFVQEFSAMRRQQDGAQLPLLVIPGNHESGGYMTEKGDWSRYFFYLEYFPHYDEDTPSTLLTTHHMHYIGRNLVIVGLDSGLMETVESQTQYLEDALTSAMDGYVAPTDITAAATQIPPASAPFVIVTYHNPAFPSLRPFSDIESVDVRNHFIPIVDRYRVPLVLEFHDHAYKRTTPVFLSDKVNTGKGAVYIGDGGIGIDRDFQEDRPAEHQDLYAHRVATFNIQTVTIFPNRTCRVSSYGVDGEIFDQVYVDKQI